MLEDSDRGSITRYSFYLTGPLETDKVGLILRGNFLRRGGSTVKNDKGEEMSQRGASVNPASLRNHSLGGKLTWKLDDRNSVWLDADTAVSDFDGQQAMRYERDKITLGSDNRTSYGKWNTTLTYNTTELFGYGRKSGGEKLKSGNLIFDTKLVAPVGDSHTLMVGGRYWDEEFEKGTLVENGLGILHTYNSALFIEDEWRLRDNLALTYGARYDHYNTWGNHTSPKGYLVWKADNNWTIKGGVSTGFKAPSLTQSAPGHTGNSGGSHNIGTINQIYIIGNPDLKPEKSVNKEIGFYYQTPEGLSLNATLFRNDFKDKIDFTDWEWVNGRKEQSYRNIDKAKTSGVELGSKIPLAQDLSLNLNYTYTKSEQTSGENAGAPLNNTPKHAATLRLNWDVNEKTTAWLRGEYRAKMNRYTDKNLNPTQQSVVDALGKEFSSYSVFDIGISRKLSDSVTLNFTVNNIFDKDFGETALVNGETYYKYIQIGKGTAGTYISGRNYWTSLNYNF